ncbi:hypothetical protein SPI_05220 [Niveomyces insectorum RCEF 264]|uniref:Uncharacterized protein n=1 Tax=Niveomyces insectorum RCEF 264 TaxID=1081102 RepID=A0A162KDY8_9HYPO|nr:hypothetical protein SPI_05220 [Niveomyces insectorum RCEF 264]
MARRKPRNRRPPPPPPPPSTLQTLSVSSYAPSVPSSVPRDAYLHVDTLASWQQLVADLGIDGYYPSKTQCKKAIKTVHVNIRDFLDAIRNDEPVRRFPSRAALQRYTLANHRFYKKKKIVPGSPLAALLETLV